MALYKGEGAVNQAEALVNLINYAKLNEKYDLTLYLVYKGDMNYLELLPKNIKIITNYEIHKK